MADAERTPIRRAPIESSTPATIAATSVPAGTVPSLQAGSHDLEAVWAALQHWVAEEVEAIVPTAGLLEERVMVVIRRANLPDVGVSQVLAQLPDVGVSPAVLTPARVGVSQ